MKSVNITHYNIEPSQREPYFCDGVLEVVLCSQSEICFKKWKTKKKKKDLSGLVR